MRKLIVTLTITLLLVLGSTPLVEWAMSPGKDWWRETGFQVGPQAALIYRCQRYGKGWPKGLAQPAKVTLAGAIMVSAYHHRHYDPRQRIVNREFRALAKAIGAQEVILYE